MCRMTHRCKCRQADNYELQSCALRPQSGPPPPRKKRLSAMRYSTLPGRRLYERLPGRRLKLLATHWPPTPRSRVRADTTTVPATATEPEWRSRARGGPRTTSSRCGGRSRGQGLQLAARASHRQAGSAGGPRPRHQLLLPGRARSHKSPARKSCGFACERVSACILCARRVIKTIWWRNARSVQYTAVYCSILQYTAVYCSILRCLGIFFLFFGHSRLLGRRWSRR